MKYNLKNKKMGEEVIIVAIVFIAIFQIIKVLTDYLLKRRLIKENLIDKAKALTQFNPENEEINKYPTLKWGLVAFFAGLGFILIEILHLANNLSISYENSFLPFGIELVFISLGFLVYFFIVSNKSKSN